VAVSGKVIKYTTGAGQAAIPLRVVPNGDGSYALAVASPFVTPVALTSPPANLTAGANTALTFASPVYVVTIENNSGEDKNVEIPSPATAGSGKVLDGEKAEFSIAAGTTTVGIYGASASLLNGSVAGNVIVKGRA
jgi:hypothetical protein